MITEHKDFFQGITAIEYGPFEARIAGSLEDSENGKSVWKTWYHPSEQHIIKIKSDLTKLEAIEMVQNISTEWRGRGKPNMTPILLKDILKQIKLKKEKNE